METITAGGTWTAPTIAAQGFTIANLRIQIWAPGGNGGAGSVANTGGGGAGGAYSEETAFPPVAGTDYTVQLNLTQDAFFKDAATVMAKRGGNGSAAGVGSNGSAGAKALASAGVGDIKFDGGTAANGTGTFSGSGGGGAGDGAVGGNATSSLGGTGGAVGGGNGGTGLLTGAGPAGSISGGGGAGGGIASGAGGAGARGTVILTYNKVYSKSIAETVPLVQDDGTNILTGDNVDFEAGIGGWLATGYTPTSSTDQANTGTHSLKLVSLGSGSGNGAFTALQTVTPGVTYVAYAFVRTAATARAVTAQILWYLTDGTTLVETLIGFAVADSTSAWQKISVAGICPPTAAKARLAVIYNTRVLSEVHYVDTASFQTSPVMRRVVYFRSPTAESIAAPTDAVTRLYTANRTIAEAIAAVTDAVVRAFVGARTISETVAAPTDTVARQLVQFRTITESIAAPSDLVARVLQANRTISEAVAAPTDSVARLAQFNRSISEAVAKVTDAVTRQTTLFRTITETLAAPTDFITRLAQFNRTILEELPGGGGSVTNIYAPIFSFDD